MTLRLLLFGRTGQVATEIRRLAGPDLAVTALGRAEADLADPEACAAAVRAADADAVINAAAYTAVDRAETEEDLATVINGAAPGAMARAAAGRGLPFLHVSTDYVFDGGQGGGEDGAWVEDDPPAPLGAYGRSKLAGERAVAEAGGAHVILRTSWVHAGHGSNFVRTMLRAGASRDQLTVIDDQIGGPTPAAAIAGALLSMARTLAAGRGDAGGGTGGGTGIFHFCGAPATSWCGFARAIFAATPWRRIPEVIAIRSEQWPTPATRPKNSRLDCSKLERCHAIKQPAWEEYLRNEIDEIIAIDHK